MKTLPQLAIITFLLLASSYTAQAGSRTSARYSIPADATDRGGKRTSSASYSNQGSAGGIGGISTVASPAETARHGYAGQLYDVIGLSLTSSSPNLNETASRQLNAAPLADDSTTLAALDPSTVAWSIVNGPFASISPSGLATAGNVYEDTSATVAGSAQNLSGQLTLTILNVGNDDYASYAGDQIDDLWQVSYFGQPPNALAAPGADPDYDGQTNLFEFIAGLIPNDASSRFFLSVASVAGQPAQKNLIFSPLVAGRTYIVTAKPSLTTGSYAPLSNPSAPSDAGTQRTVTDLSASGAAKFYRVEITKP